MQEMTERVMKTYFSVGGRKQKLMRTKETDRSLLL